MFTTIEIIALIFIIISLTKIIYITLNPTSWNKRIVKKIWKNPHATSFISLILALIILFYLIKELTIIQILATSAFVSMLILYAFSIFSKELMNLTNKFYKGRTILKRASIYIILWLILLLWGLKEILI